MENQQTNPRIVFLGNHDIGHNCLEWLVDQGENVVGVIGVPADPTEHNYYKSVRGFAEKRGIPNYGIENIKSDAAYELVKGMEPDLLFTISYRQILPKRMLDLPRLGGVNLHASPLPRYRGCAPLSWVIIEGETETAITYHYLAEKVDQGDIIAQQKLAIGPNETGGELWDRVTVDGFELFKRIYPGIKTGNAPRKRQEGESSYFGRRTPADGLIDWNSSATQIHNLVRAVTSPLPGAFTHLNGEKFYVWKVEKRGDEAARGAPGQLESRDDGLYVNTGDGYVVVTDATFMDQKLTGEGLRELNAHSFE